MIALFICVYLIGYVLAYILIRNDFKHTYRNWTIGDRKFALCFSLLSWVSVIIVFSRSNSDKPASW